MSAVASETAPTGAEALAASAGDPPTGEDAEKGKLFEIPKVKIDTTQPTVLKLAVAGGIEIERNDQQWVEFYNDLQAGKSREVTVTVFAAGAKKTHRRDPEGDVDAVVETKSLIVTDFHLDGGE